MSSGTFRDSPYSMEHYFCLFGFYVHFKFFYKVLFLCAIKLAQKYLQLPLRQWGAGNVYLICLVLLQVPKCFGLLQIFCARPKIYLHFVAVTNILCQTKRWFASSKIGFCASTKVFEEAIKCSQLFELAQNI